MLALNDPLSITHETFDPFEISIQLGRISRYAGLGKFNLSVAQHCVTLAAFVPERLQLAALTHDISEAFIGDVPVVAKRKSPEIVEYENSILKHLGALIGVTMEEYKAVHPYDVAIREDEMIALGLKMFPTKPLLGANITHWGEDYAIKRWREDFILYTYNRRTVMKTKVVDQKVLVIMNNEPNSPLTAYIVEGQEADLAVEAAGCGPERSYSATRNQLHACGDLWDRLMLGKKGTPVDFSKPIEVAFDRVVICSSVRH